MLYCNIKRRIYVGLLLAASLPLMGVDDCLGKQKTIATLVHVLGNAVASLASVVDGNADLSQRLIDHTNTAVAIIRAWKPGMNPGDAIRALNRVIDDVNHLTGLEQYKPLITLALGTAASIIDLIREQSGGSGEQAHTDIHLVMPPRNDKEFKSDWDSIRAASTDMKAAPVL